jgi:hypothetical protein
VQTASTAYWLDFIINLSVEPFPRELVGRGDVSVRVFLILQYLSEADSRPSYGYTPPTHSLATAKRGERYRVC